MNQLYKHQYFKEIEIVPVNTFDNDVVQLADLDYLPDLVRKYLIYSGVVGKKNPSGFQLQWKGYFKTAVDKKWCKMKALQTNCLVSSSRFFYMVLYMMGIPVYGLHIYKKAVATMKIKIAGIFQVADAKGHEMNQGETVTFFNDMCFFCPSWILKSDIKWESVDKRSIKAYYTNYGITISAIL